MLSCRRLAYRTEARAGADSAGDSDDAGGDDAQRSTAMAAPVGSGEALGSAPSSSSTGNLQCTHMACSAMPYCIIKEVKRTKAVSVFRAGRQVAGTPTPKRRL